MEITTAIRQFAKLKVDRSKGVLAPHKAIRLISVIRSMSNTPVKFLLL